MNSKWRGKEAERRTSQLKARERYWRGYKKMLKRSEFSAFAMHIKAILKRRLSDREKKGQAQLRDKREERSEENE